MPRSTLVIGDVHGHLDRLEALLRQEGVLDDRGIRTNFDVEVVLLGDLGHFGEGGSPTGDMLVWQAAVEDEWADVILWGNHDWAVVDDSLRHAYYMGPEPAVKHIMRSGLDAGKVKLAHVSHGFLLTHAGLHKGFRDQVIPEEIKTDPKVFADWINVIADPRVVHDKESYLAHRNQVGVRNSISARRGGRESAGGILWRDIDEKLYMPFRQVFGHSADHEKHQVRYCWEKANSRVPQGNVMLPSYCVDVGGKGDRPGDPCLAGIWLPQETVVRVDL